jgi:hypothetical protein
MLVPFAIIELSRSDHFKFQVLQERPDKQERLSLPVFEPLDANQTMEHVLKEDRIPAMLREFDGSKRTLPVNGLTIYWQRFSEPTEPDCS